MNKIFKVPDGAMPSGFAIHEIPAGFESWVPPSRVEISREEAVQILAANRPQPPREQLVSETRIKAKTLLLQILPLLDSMQVDALDTGESVVWQGYPTPLSTVIRQLKAGLRSVADMDLSAYETAEQMEDAIQAAYFYLAIQAPPQIKAAFDSLKP